MRLLSLHLKNFRQYADTQIRFQPGVTAIVGANGAGKTTLLEAIAWALYGSPAIRGSNDSLRRAGAPARSPVEATLEFSLGAHRYRIYRRPDRAELFVDGSASPAHSGVQPVAEAVRKLLGMDYRAFFTSYFTGQKELAFLAGMGKQERATSVGRMLGYDRLSRAREKSNQDRLALEKEIKGLENGMGDPKEIADARKSADDAFAGAQKAVAASQKRLAKARAALETVTPKYELSVERKTRYDDTTRQIELVDRDRTSVDAEIRNVRRELARLDELESEYRRIGQEVEEYRRAEREFDTMRPLLKYEKERQLLLGEGKALKAEIAHLLPDTEGMDEAQAELRALVARLHETETALSLVREEGVQTREEWSRQRSEVQAERKGLEARLKEVETRRSRVDALGEGDCPTCARPLGDDLRSVLAHFEEEILVLNREASALRARESKWSAPPARIAQLQGVVKEKESEIKSLQVQREVARCRVGEIRKATEDLGFKRNALAEVEAKLARLPTGFDQARFEELSEVAKRLKPISKRAVEIENELSRRPEWNTRLLEAERRWAELDERWTALEKDLKKIKFSPESHQKVADDYAAAAGEERTAERDAADAETDLARAEGASRSAREREEEYLRKLEVLKEKQAQRLSLRTLTEAMEGLRLDLNARVRPELEAVASDFLAQLTDGRYAVLELTEQYEPYIVEDRERKTVISGGEEDVTHLCLRLAISRMIADRSGQPLSLLVLDEIFGSLDAARRENVVTLLQNLKGIFEQIVLITHIESIHDVVDQCLWVSYDSGSRASRVTESRDEAPLTLDDLGDLSEAA